MVSLTAYALLTNTISLSKHHTGKFVIPIAATRHAQEELKHQYVENIRVFHKKRGVG